MDAGFPPLRAGSLMCESSENFPADVCRTVNFFSSQGGDGDVINEIVISGGVSMVSGRVYALVSLVVADKRWRRSSVTQGRTRTAEERAGRQHRGGNMSALSRTERRASQRRSEASALTLPAV